MIQLALQALRKALAQVSAGKDQWQKKAHIICSFAMIVSDEACERAGFSKTQGSHPNFTEAFVGWHPGGHRAGDDHRPKDMVDFIVLYPFPVSYDGPCNRMKEGFLLFAEGRVFFQDKHYNVHGKTMSYDRACEFMVFFLLQQIANTLRTLEPERSRRLADLLNHLDQFVSAEIAATR